ncbi:MAG: ABC transporter permease [Turneriella sp.]|nr:ABC transporter permease [Leptospiraceae bacterium]MCX7632118.1 ABC transporter permease [Turneriella sp.]
MLELENTWRSYQLGEHTVHALRGVTLKIAADEFVAIMGRSGSGKSTLLYLLGLLDRPTAGSYRILGKEVSQLDDNTLAGLRTAFFGFIFQQFHLLPRLNALENAAMPLLYSGKNGDAPLRLLREVGLFDRIAHRPGELSGGQKQRVAIARALVNAPRVLLADEPTGSLDSISQQEILDLLSMLHRSGTGIIVVTHDEEVASCADRIIRLQDGEIVSDRRRKKYARAVPPATFPIKISQRPKLHLYLKALLAEGWRAIVANKLRSALSMLGILIGVASVIAMLALGRGAQKSIEAQLSGLGANVLVVRASAVRIGGVVQESGHARLFPDDVPWLRQRVAGIRAITGNALGRAQVSFGNKNWSTTVQGTGVEYATIRNATPFLGRMFTLAEEQSRARVAILGLTVVRELYGDQNPIGTTIKINKVSFQVIGVMPAKGGTGFRDQDDVVVVPLNTALFRLFGRYHLDSLDVEVAPGYDVDTTGENIRNALLTRRRLPLAQQDDAYQVLNLADIRAAVKATSSTMAMLLASIAAVSLLVGGIGIMNIMLVSVTERTAEIGLRKAVGARRRDILLQFLIETLVISTTGGILGIALGILIALAMSSLAGWAVIVSGFSLVLAVSFSLAIGLVFGLWPARKAAALDPIAALRHE